MTKQLQLVVIEKTFMRVLLVILSFLLSLSLLLLSTTTTDLCVCVFVFVCSFVFLYITGDHALFRFCDV